MNESMIKVGITQGDINGVGYEVILKTLSDSRILELCTPVIYGSAKVAAYHRKAMDLPTVGMSIINNAEGIEDGRVNIINCVKDDIKVELSKSTPEAGESSYLALECASEDLKKGFIDVLVTAPVNKENMRGDEFNFRGHAEYLEQKAGGGNRALMILVKDEIRVALVTGHVPIADVPGLLTVDLILSTLKIFNRSLIADFAIRAPRIAVLSLNPHAGENGLLGKEEQQIIIPAIAVAEKESMLVFGPYSSDDFFGSGKFELFDGVLAMYHDQGLTPFKSMTMEDGVNFTAGLPFVRTSPDHGTAYDIAGQNLALEDSFRNAMYLAIDIFRNRSINKEINVNPLKKEYVERGSDNEKLDLTKDDN